MAKKPTPEMLGTGTASKAAKALRDRKKRQEEQLRKILGSGSPKKKVTKKKKAAKKKKAVKRKARY